MRVRRSVAPDRSSCGAWPHRRPRSSAAGSRSAVDRGRGCTGRRKTLTWAGLRCQRFHVHALIQQAGGVPRHLGVARDSEVDILGRLSSPPRPDLLVTSGGVSVGDFDVVKGVLRAHGSIAIWQVRMKPGIPAFGTLDGTPLLGSPGNPVAAFVSFLQFGRPLVRRLLARRDSQLSELRAPAC